MRFFFPDKECVFCGTSYNRRRFPGGGLEGIPQFKKRKYCSDKCRFAAWVPLNYWEGKEKPDYVKKQVSASLLGNKRALGKRWIVLSRRNPDRPEMLRIRNSSQMAEWRKAVFTRDNYTCQLCGERGGKLHADHIKSFLRFPDLRFDIANGRTLCVPCHQQTPNYGYRARLQ